MEIAVIDLETTGFSPASGDRIIEIGIVFLNENLEQIRTFQSLVNPGRSIPDTVHGISSRDLDGQPTFADVLAPLLGELHETSCLVAHNISFEKRFLVAEFDSLNRRLPETLLELCTRKTARSLGIGSNQKLGTLVRELGIRMTGPSHRALPDAIATVELLRHLHQTGGVLPALHRVDWGSSSVIERFPPREPVKGHDARMSRPRRGSSPDGEVAGAPSEANPNTGRGYRLPVPQEGDRPMSDDLRNVGISRPVLILISNLSIEGEKARLAAESLIQQARRHTDKLDPAIEALTPFLSSGDFGVRAAVAAALGHIGTSGAIKALVRAFEQCPAHELSTECSYSGCYEEPLCECLANAIGENENKMTAKALVSLLCSRTVPNAAKAGLMLKLADFDLEETKVRWPPDIVDALEAMVSSDDPRISEGAIRLLGAL